MLVLVILIGLEIIAFSTPVRSINDDCDTDNGNGNGIGLESGRMMTEYRDEGAWRNARVNTCFSSDRC